MMNESFVFKIPTASKYNQNFVYDLGFGLHKILSNDRTTIYQNNEMRLCVDEKVIRVMLFDKTNHDLLEKLREFFYGENYRKL